MTCPVPAPVRGRAELLRARVLLADGPVDDARESFLLAASLLADPSPAESGAAVLGAADAAWAAGDPAACLRALVHEAPPGPEARRPCLGSEARRPCRDREPRCGRPAPRPPGRHAGGPPGAVRPRRRPVGRVVDRGRPPPSPSGCCVRPPPPSCSAT
ncbi:hypothetical protein ACR6C2_02970 [Streptomyces sp. INA 01156]